MKKLNLKLAIGSIVALLAVSTAASAASFKDNTLIRGKDGKIFVVRQGQRDKVKNLTELRRNFRGQEIINVDDKTLAGIKVRSANSGRGSVRSGSNRVTGGIKSDNSLIRSRDSKIFVTGQGERRHISDLSELRREHAGEVIHNVDDAILNRFPRVVDDVNELRQEHLSQASHDVDDNVLREFELRGRANEPGEDIRGNADENEIRGQGDMADDFVNGVKLRGDGTVDDNLPRHSGLDDLVNGVKLRGDGTVDDNSTDSGRDRSSNDSSSSGRGGSSGSSRGSSDD